jgi:hypothetical protein
MHLIVYKQKTVLVCIIDVSIYKKKNILGSATACVLGIDCYTGQLHSVNIGDSGYVVVRHDRVVYRSRSQKMNGDCPRQLDVYPWTASLKRKGLNYTQIS